MTYRTHARLFSSQFYSLASILLFLWLNSLVSGWVCPWKPCWIPVGESVQKAFLEEWIHMGDDSSGEQCIRWYRVLVTKIRHPNQSYLKKHLQPPRSAGQPDALTWEPIGPQGAASFRERTEAPLPPLRPRCNFVHPKQLSPFPERLELPSEEILSGFEDIVSSGTDQFTTWVETGPDATLVRHMVDVQKSHCRFSRGVGKETRYIFSGIPLQQKFA